MLTSTQTDNKYRKNAANKKVLLKNGSEVFKHIFNILCQIAFSFFNKMPTLWSSEANKAILDYDYMLQSFKKQKLCTQN